MKDVTEKFEAIMSEAHDVVLQLSNLADEVEDTDLTDELNGMANDIEAALSNESEIESMLNNDE